MREELKVVSRAAPLPSPTLRDVVAVIFRQRRLILVCFPLIFCGVLAYGIFSPSYQARMKILVRRSRIDPAAAPTWKQGQILDNTEVTDEDLNSEVELLRDGEILRRVASSSGSVKSSWKAWLRPDNPERQLAAAARAIGKRLTVEPVRKTTLIAVTYSASDPARAATVLRCLAGAYLQRHVRLRRPSGEFDFFEQQVARSRQKLEIAEHGLMDFTHDQGVVSAGLERDQALQRLNQAEDQEHQEQISLKAGTRRILSLKEALHQLPERKITQMHSADNGPLLEALKSRLLELDLKRTELLTRFAPSYRLVQEVDQQIRQASDAIAAERQSPVHEQTTDRDSDHDWAQAELLKTEVDMQSLHSRHSATRELVAAYRTAAAELGNRSIEQNGLLRDVKRAEDDYLLYLNKREEARISDALDQGGLLDVMIAEQPVVPALPARSPVTYGLIGIVLATAGSTGSAFVADYLDPAFRNADEVAGLLGAPVLASLPRRNS